MYKANELWVISYSLSKPYQNKARMSIEFDSRVIGGVVIAPNLSCYKSCHCFHESAVLTT